MTEGVEVAKRPREESTRSVVVHAFEPHEHPYLTTLPVHTHEEIKGTEDHLARRINENAAFIQSVQETLRAHGHEVQAHEHPDKPMPVHEHPHGHNDLSRALESLQGLTTKLSADLATVTVERDNTAILARLMAVEGEARTIAGILTSHTHDHEHPDLAAAIKDEGTHRRADINSLENRIESHGHGAYAMHIHEHPHVHSDLKAGIERVEAKALEVMVQGTEIVAKLATVDSTHHHADTEAVVTKLTQDLGTAERQLARHEHPHEHAKTDERIAKLDEKLGGHAHDYADKVHEHAHAHEEIAHLDALYTILEGEFHHIRGRLNRIERAGYLTSIPVHTHGEYLTEIPVHEHPRYDEALTAHIEAAKTSVNLRVLSKEETAGKSRIIAEVVD